MREGAYVIHRLAGSQQYKGAATELFDFAVKLAEEHNIHVLLTDTFALNKPAQGLFEKFGFIKVGEAKLTIIHLIEAHHSTHIIKHLRIEVNYYV